MSFPATLAQDILQKVRGLLLPVGVRIALC
jgi:hypothetical protein